MGDLIKAGLKLVGLAGGGIPTGWVIAGAVLAILSILGGTWKAGYNYRATIDETAALRLENERLAANAAEVSRQMDSVNRIQQADTDRAAAAIKRANELQQQIDDTPANTAPCLDNGARGRVFGPRKRPAVR